MEEWWVQLQPMRAPGRGEQLPAQAAVEAAGHLAAASPLLRSEKAGCCGGQLPASAAAETTGHLGCSFVSPNVGADRMLWLLLDNMSLSRRELGGLGKPCFRN